MYIGTRTDLRPPSDGLGDIHDVRHAFLAFLIAPVIGIVNIGTQISEALAGLERTREVLRERPEDEDPERSRKSPTDRGRSRLRECRVRIRGWPACAARHFVRRPRPAR
jgi:ABC-type multidrug transport system fused ATPase/permease subunit